MPHLEPFNMMMIQSARENAQTFGGAAKVGCRIYSTLAGDRKKAQQTRTRNPQAHSTPPTKPAPYF
jgi:hypothetical protein